MSTKKIRNISLLIILVSALTLLSALTMSPSGTGGSGSLAGTAGGGSPQVFEGTSEALNAGQDTTVGFSAVVLQDGRAEFQAEAHTGDIVDWQWDFGDGAKGYGENVIYQYQQTGDYTVRLNAMSPDEDIASAELNIEVPSIASQSTKDEASASEMLTQDVQLVNIAGETLGTGSAQVQADRIVGPNEVATIQLELRLNNNDIIAEIDASTEAEDTSSSDDDQSVQPASEVQSVTLSRFMSADLAGIDSENFEIDVNQSGIKEITEDEITQWIWTLKPKNEAIGSNHMLRVSVSQPRRLDTGDDVSIEVATFDVPIAVSRTSLSQVVIIIMSSTALLVGLIIFGYSYVNKYLNAYRRARFKRVMETDQSSDE